VPPESGEVAKIGAVSFFFAWQSRKHGAMPDQQFCLMCRLGTTFCTDCRLGTPWIMKERQRIMGLENKRKKLVGRGFLSLMCRY